MKLPGKYVGGGWVFGIALDQFYRWGFARRHLAPVVLATAAVLTGCAGQTHAPLSDDVADRQNLSGFPYHPLVYHLDLSTLAYHLHAQTLIWPFDPYYEALPGGEIGRANFMAKVQGWAGAKGREQAAARPNAGDYRGPGRLAGFDDNPLHDPILYRYDGLAPWQSAITNTGDRWVEYLPSAPIADRIHDVYMCQRRPSAAHDTVSVGRVASNSAARGSGARDVLLAFEGSTGDKGETGHPASQSLLGFVLLRHRAGSGAYDIHISLRGSRSGSLLRAVAQANWDVRARGNPDWITDLGYGLVSPEDKAAHITTTGAVHRGFARSLELTLPNIFACLGKAASLGPGSRPENIYVTGHSPGGGLAQQFVSAMTLGDQYGPNGGGPAMPRALRTWPWQQIKLITFSAPRAGDPVWAETLTTQVLASDFHARDRLRYDYNALVPNDPSIVARLADPTTPVGYRVLVTTDAVSTSVVAGRKPVGKTVYADKLRSLAIAAPYDPDSHEPAVVRDFMVASLSDSDIPPALWRYRKFSLAKAGEAGNPEREMDLYTRLQTIYLRYHSGLNPDFDAAAFERDAEIFNLLLAEE